MQLSAIGICCCAIYRTYMVTLYFDRYALVGAGAIAIRATERLIQQISHDWRALLIYAYYNGGSERARHTQTIVRITRLGIKANRNHTICASTRGPARSNTPDGTRPTAIIVAE